MIYNLSRLNVHLRFEPHLTVQAFRIVFHGCFQARLCLLAYESSCMTRIPEVKIGKESSVTC